MPAKLPRVKSVTQLLSKEVVGDRTSKQKQSCSKRISAGKSKATGNFATGASKSECAKFIESKRYALCGKENGVEQVAEAGMALLGIT
ncbi:hypothetical protein D5086_033980 [Populus alba]|uniref:Uncharacterized protein n=1 Tax=Populus alba TaxID=43335 RepID=A0ACC4AE19_POPAL